MKQFDERTIAAIKNEAPLEGIVDFGRYRTAKLNVLWILKQDIDFGDDGLVERIKRYSRTDSKGSPTFRRIAQCSYALLSGLRDYDEILGSRPSLYNASLAEIAIIELIKSAGDSRTSNSEVIAGYNTHKGLIHRQISAYRPDVAIITGPEGICEVVDSIYRFCSNGRAFQHKNERLKGADTAYASAGDIMYMWAYHPQATRGYGGLGVSDKSYLESITKACDKCLTDSFPDWHSLDGSD